MVSMRGRFCRLARARPGVQASLFSMHRDLERDRDAVGLRDHVLADARGRQAAMRGRRGLEDRELAGAWSE
jgi:hypothetical protein